MHLVCWPSCTGIALAGNKTLSKSGQNSLKNRSKLCQNSVKTLSFFYSDFLLFRSPAALPCVASPPRPSLTLTLINLCLRCSDFPSGGVYPMYLCIARIINNGTPFALAVTRHLLADALLRVMNLRKTDLASPCAAVSRLRIQEISYWE